MCFFEGLNPRILSRVLVALFCLGNVPALALAAPNCLGLLECFNAVVEARQKREPPPFRFGEVDQRVVELTGPVRQAVDEDGPSLVYVESDENSMTVRVLQASERGAGRESWASKWSAKPLAAHEDPRTALFVYGVEAGYVLGFEIPANAKRAGKSLKIPTRKRLNQGTGWLKEKLPEGQKIKHSYYDPKILEGKGGVDAGYVDELADPDQVRLPYEDGFSLGVHDASSHLSFAIPDQIWVHVSKVCRAEKSFRPFLKNQLRALKMPEEDVLGLLGGIDHEIVRAIDIGNGDFSAALLAGNRQGMIESGMERLGFNGRSPKEVLKEKMRSVFFLAWLPGNKNSRQAYPERKLQFEKYYAAYSGILDKFEAVYRDPAFSQTLDLSPDEFLKISEQRVEAIRKAGRQIVQP